jgi:regulator of sigma E protease
MLLTLVSLVVVLGVLIFVHELGHFVVAKAVGIQVLRFSLGFGRPVIAFKRGETEYWISWIPLGGYVKMAGLEEEGMVGELEGGKADASIDPERAFDRQPLWARMAVIVAGVTMNVLFAFALYTTLNLTYGEPRTAITPVDTVDVQRLPAAARELASLKRGDQIVRINGDTVETWDDVQEQFLSGPETTRVEIAGRPEPLVLRFTDRDRAVRRQALVAVRALIRPQIGIVTPGQPAAHARMQLGDLVLRANGDTIRSWDEMVRTIRGSPGKQLALDVLRGDSIVHLTVVPQAETQTDSLGRRTVYGLIGASPDPRSPTVRVPVGVGAAVADGAAQTVFQIGAIVISVKRLIFGQASAREVGGPILIAQMSGQMARLGLEWFLRFLAFFSITLAVLNMLPIPVLDGGHAMFLIVEGIRRKPLSPQLRLRLTQVGMLLVLAIMVLAISNDVLRFFR